MRNGESGPLSLCLNVRKNFLMAGDVQNESGMSSLSIGVFKQNLESHAEESVFLEGQLNKEAPSQHPTQSPVLQQQGTQDTGPVLWPNLVRHNHCLHHKMCDAWQSGLLQVQEGSSWGHIRGADTAPSDSKTPLPHCLASPGEANVLGEPSAQCAQADTQFHVAMTQPEERGHGPSSPREGSHLLVNSMWTDSYSAPGTVPGTRA